MPGLGYGIAVITWQQAAMILIGLFLIYVAIRKGYEPLLLLPIGFGAIITNIPGSSAVGPEGFLTRIYELGIVTEIFPILIFIGIGAMMDFGPLFDNPGMFIFGLVAQSGVLLTMGLARVLGFTLKESATIGMIGAADGPTSIYVAVKFARHLLGPVTVAAYSYMSLVPMIQPPVIRLLTTRAERQIRAPIRQTAPASRALRIAFPIAVTLLMGLIAPSSVALVGSLMFGNLLREARVTERLARAAQEYLVDLVTLLLGITIGSTMVGAEFLKPGTILVLGMGLLAFVLDTACGVLAAKALNLVLKVKINPMIGACGISAFPMSARLVQKMAYEEDRGNIILMQAASANASGQIASVLVGAALLAFIR